MSTARWLAVVGLALSGALGSEAAEPAKPAAPANVSYYKDIRPILQQHCQGCHQPAKAQGGYIMTSVEALKQAGNTGKPPVVAGKPDASYLVQQLLPAGGKPAAMPKEREPLSETQVALIRSWITQGAADDTPASVKRIAIDEEHPPVYELPPVITALAYSPDSQLLAVAGYHEVLLHRADGSGLVGRLVGASERIQSLAFSPDGTTLAVAGGNPARFGEIQLWDVSKKKLKLSVSITYDTVNGVSWSPDGSKVAFGCNDNTLRAIDTTTGKQVLFQGAHNDWVLDTAFSSDGKYLVSVSRDRSLKLTEVATQRFIDNVTSITPGVLKGGLATVALRPQKEKKTIKASSIAVADTEEKVYEELLIGGADGQPKLYKMHRESKRVIGDDANKVREYERTPGRVYDVDFSADGSRFAAASSSDGKGEVRVFETDSGKRIAVLEGERGGVFAVSFRRDGKAIASAGFDGMVRLNDPTTGKLLKEFVPVPLTTRVSGK